MKFIYCSNHNVGVFCVSVLFCFVCTCICNEKSEWKLYSFTIYSALTAFLCLRWFISYSSYSYRLQITIFSICVLKFIAIGKVKLEHHTLTKIKEIYYYKRISLDAIFALWTFSFCTHTPPHTFFSSTSHRLLLSPAKFLFIYKCLNHLCDNCMNSELYFYL